MNPNQQPLTDGSLKSVLEFLDPNKRLQLAFHYPSIRNVEKTVPLKLDSVHLGARILIINGIEYQLSTHREYFEGIRAPKLHEMQNEMNYHGDLDQFGVGDYDAENEVTPGDIVMSDRPMNLPREMKPGNISDEEIIECITSEIQQYEKFLQNPSQGETYYQAFDGRVGDTPIEALKEELDQLRPKLKAYTCRRDGLLPPFEIQLKLSIIERGNDYHDNLFKEPILVSWKRFTKADPQRGRMYGMGMDYSEDFYINKHIKLHKAMKNLTTLFFGNRRDPIIVKRMSVEDTPALRMPVGVKFKIEEVPFIKMLSLDRLIPIIDPESFPLNFLKANATQLVDFVGNCIRRWAKIDAKVGESFSFKISIDFEILMSGLLNRTAGLNGRKEQKNLVVPLGENKEIRVIFELNTNADISLGRILKMMVVSIQTSLDVLASHLTIQS